MAKKQFTKIGTGHAAAMFRLGLAELRALSFFQESNIAQPAPHGLVGTRTAGEVMLDKKLEMRDPDEKPSVLDERLKQVEKDRAGREPEPPQPERE